MRINGAIVFAFALCCGVSAAAQTQLTPEGFPLPSPLLGNEIVDCQVLSSPYITTCTTGQIAALGGSATILVNASGGGVAPGTVVYINGAGQFGAAIASSYSTAGAVAFATNQIPVSAAGKVATAGGLQLTTAQWDAITGGSGGLVPGLLYFLSPASAGKITTTPPTTPGQLVVVVGRALSPTVMLVAIQTPIQL